MDMQVGNLDDVLGSIDGDWPMRRMGENVPDWKERQGEVKYGSTRRWAYRFKNISIKSW